MPFRPAAGCRPSTSHIVSDNVVLRQRRDGHHADVDEHEQRADWASLYRVGELSGGNLLKNADDGPAGVGALLTPDVGDDVLSPGESMTVTFVINLASRASFSFFVHVLGEPGPLS